MKNNSDHVLRTRREFLRTSLLGGALSYTVPAFLANTFSALHAAAADSAIQTATGRDSSILVILQMAGGNDGINTVVPYSNDFYQRARPNLRMSADKVLKLNDEIGFHPSLSGLKALYDSGNLAVIQGSGYPNPNRSHFRSTEIWQTASDSERIEKYGWLGRYFDNSCKGCDPTVGISVGRQSPQAFASKNGLGVSLDNPQSYRFLAETRAGDTEKSYRELNAPDGAMRSEDTGAADNNSGDSIGMIHGSTQHAGSALDFLERTAMDAQVSSDKIIAVSNKAQNKATYPGSQLANSLKLVARLIGGGLPTRVYYVSQGGYDTHTNQLPTQQRLLKELGDSLKAFTEDLKAQGNNERTLVMTFSEFGRRVAENANNGTDHGAAAPMFVIGNKVKAGLLGKYPSLAPADLVNGDMKFNVDFRSVYAGILEGWLKTPSAPVLGQKFPPLMCV